MRARHDLYQVTTIDENVLQPTKWAKESSPGQSERFLASDALGHCIPPSLTPRSGAGGLPAPDRGVELYFGIPSQGYRGERGRRSTPG